MIKKIRRYEGGDSSVLLERIMDVVAQFAEVHRGIVSGFAAALCGMHEAVQGVVQEGVHTKAAASRWSAGAEWSSACCPGSGATAA